MNALENIKTKINLELTEKYPETNYSECYVAFLDILGMKNLVQKNYSELRKIFNSIESVIKLYGLINIPGGEKFLSQNQIRITVMSDSIVLSIKKEIGNSFSKIIGVSSAIINSILNAISEPVFIRGGISCGNLSHTDFSVVGPGLVEAYNLENDKAEYMRCIISPKLYSESDFKEFVLSQKELIKDDKDELYFIDFIRPENQSLIRNFARLQLKSEKLDESIKRKYRWLMNYLGEE